MSQATHPITVDTLSTCDPNIWLNAFHVARDRGDFVSPSSTSVPTCSPPLPPLQTICPTDVSDIVALLLPNNNRPHLLSPSPPLLPITPAPQISHSPPQSFPLPLIRQSVDSPSREPLTVCPAHLSLIPNPVATQASTSDACIRILNASGTHPSLLVRDLQRQGAPVWSEMISEVPRLLHHYLFTNRLGRELSVKACNLILHYALSWVSVCNPAAQPEKRDLTLQFRTVESNMNMRFSYKTQDVKTGWDEHEEREKLFSEGLRSDMQCTSQEIRSFIWTKVNSLIDAARFNVDYALDLEWVNDTAFLLFHEYQVLTEPDLDDDTNVITQNYSITKWFGNEELFNAVARAIYDPSSPAFLELMDTEDSPAVSTWIPLLLMGFILVALKDRSKKSTTKKAQNCRIGELTAKKQINANVIANQLEDFFNDVNKADRGTLSEEQSTDRKVNLIRVLSRPEWLPHSASMEVLQRR
ncbi:hypothetical protein BU15DRAFT_73076 [Melanogaster broomeanus]|nr:hypothetical protein BU15DRAFT_73076 [Melanogaster broomeanus]